MGGQRHAPAASPRALPGTCCTGGWVGLLQKIRSYWDSIPEPSSPYDYEVPVLFPTGTETLRKLYLLSLSGGSWREITEMVWTKVYCLLGNRCAKMMRFYTPLSQYPTQDLGLYISATYPSDNKSIKMKMSMEH
jgi:hypothetical protein